MGLNAKQERSAYVALGALHELGRHMFMWGVPKQLLVKVDVPDDIIVGGLYALVFGEGPAVTAGAMILDAAWPGWRSKFPELAGFAAERGDAEARRWRSSVLERDGGICQRCGGHDDLEAHHVMPWAVAPEARLIVSNGITLCSGCHREEHRARAPMETRTRG